MKKLIVISLFSCFCLSLFSQSVEYPITEKIPVEKTFFDTVIIDDYDWMTDVHSEKTNTWIKEQRKLSRKQLRKTRIKEGGYHAKLNNIGNVDFNLPAKIGHNYYKYMYPRLNSSAAVYIQKRIKSKPRLLIDPQDIAFRDYIDIRGLAESKNGKYLAFLFGRNGSDWREIKVKKTNGIGYLKDHIKGAKFTNLAWKGDGFYYLKYKRKDKFSAETTPELYYHRLKTEQEEDELIYKRNGTNFYEVGFEVTFDERFLLVYETDEKKGTVNIFYQDLMNPDSKLKPLLMRMTSNIEILGNAGEEFYGLTGLDSENTRIVKFNSSNPTKWKEVVPAYTDGILLDAKFMNNLFICEYINKTSPLVIVYDQEGEIKDAIKFEAGYSIGGFMGEQSDFETVYYYTSYFLPPIVYTYNLNTFDVQLLQKTEVDFHVDKFEITYHEYLSKDGISVPMTIFSKKGITKDGTNPTLLKTYGGFGSIHTPSFDRDLIDFLEQGGVFAYAHVRGEGNLGRKWVAGGRKENKQNSIDDLIAGAEFLISENYTSSEKLAVTGASHGGIMVAAAMIQRPELFKVVVPQVGVFDLLEAENYTVGAFHKDEFGSVEVREEFENLLSYSPYHNIQPGVNYPTTLIMTAENDDRVPPFHSYKFAAKLQNNPGQINPIYLRIEKKGGHSGAPDLDGEILESADMYSFILYHLK